MDQRGARDHRAANRRPTPAEARSRRPCAGRGQHDVTVVLTQPGLARAPIRAQQRATGRRAGRHRQARDRGGGPRRRTTSPIYPTVPTYLATYSWTGVAMDSLVSGAARRGRPAGQAAGHHPDRGRPRHRALPYRPRPGVPDMATTHRLDCAGTSGSPVPRRGAAALGDGGARRWGGTGRHRAAAPGADRDRAARRATATRCSRGSGSGSISQPDRRRGRPAAPDRPDGRDPARSTWSPRSARSTASAAPPQAGGTEGDYVDPRTGVTVYDTYGKSPRPDGGLLTGRPTSRRSLFDIQDVGARFYTYIWTMYDCMVAAALGRRALRRARPAQPDRRRGGYGPMHAPRSTRPSSAARRSPSSTG